MPSRATATPLLDNENGISRVDKKRLREISRAQAVVDACIADKDGKEEYIGLWPQIIREALDELTPKQRRFAIFIGSGSTQSKAYTSAYDPSPDTDPAYIASSASTLASHPNVSKAISLISEWLDSKWLMDSTEAIDYALSQAYEIASTASDNKTRLSAIKMIAQINGAFVSRSEVRHVHTVDTPMTELVEGMASLLSLAVPKTPLQIEQADVAAVEFIDAEKPSQ